MYFHLGEVLQNAMVSYLGSELVWIIIKGKKAGFLSMTLHDNMTEPLYMLHLKFGVSCCFFHIAGWQGQGKFWKHMLNGHFSDPLSALPWSFPLGM